MSIYSAFSTDSQAEREGITLDFGPEIGQFQIARAGGANERFKSAVRRVVGPHQRSIDMGLIPESQARELMAECYAEAIVLGWSGVKDRDGKELVFSKQACKALLMELPELFNVIQEEAQKMANFLQAKREIAARD